MTLSTIPDLTAATGVPRLVGVEHPEGRTVGRPGDRDGQLAVLRPTLRALAEMTEPGAVRYVDTPWQVSDAEAKQHPPDPPIVSHLKRNPLQVRKLFSREIPQ